MPTTTTNYGLTKPETNDNYDVNVQNGNMDIIDAELAKRQAKDGDAATQTVSFAVASTRATPATGEKIGVIVGKIAKWLSDLGTAALCSAEAFAAASHKHNKADITDFPASMTPTAHKGTHATGGSDALSPSDIGAAAIASGTATLSTSGWVSSGPLYKYVLSDSRILATDHVNVNRAAGTDASAATTINVAWALLLASGINPQSDDGTLTMYATAVPSVNIPIYWEVTR